MYDKLWTEEVMVQQGLFVFDDAIGDDTISVYFYCN